MSKQAKMENAFASLETPFYLFDERKVIQRIGELRDILPNEVRICYAMKANSFILRSASGASDLVEVCSPGELAICRELKIPCEKLVISGVHKDRKLIESLVRSRAQVHRYTVESLTQFEMIESAAREAGVVVPVLLRVSSGNQFGMSVDDVKCILRAHCVYTSVHVCGIQYFSGTQKSSPKKLRRELETLDTLVEQLIEECDVPLLELEYGPGIPVDYCESDASASLSADREYLEALSEALSSMRFSGVKTLEIGRGIAAACGVYVTRVVDVKRNHGHAYAIVDGGKHQMVYYGQALALKPPLCHLIPVRETDKTESWAVCGSLCTSSDMLVKQMVAGDVRIGDYVVFQNTGAYCMTEGIALFLSRDLPRIYLQDESGAMKLARDRIETSVFNTPQV